MSDFQGALNTAVWMLDVLEKGDYESLTYTIPNLEGLMRALVSRATPQEMEAARADLEELGA